MEIWDQGRYDLLEWQPNKIEFRLKGVRSSAAYVLFRPGANRAPSDRGRPERWMIHLVESPRTVPTSALPNPQGGGGTTAAGNRSEPAQGAGSEMPATLEPMKATLATSVPSDDSEWAFEVKWDGFRTVAFVEQGHARLQSRTRSDITEAFPSIASVPAAVGHHDVILDGEICALDEDGKPDFSLLQQRSKRPADIVYMLFDLLYLDGQWLGGLPYRQRRQFLETLQVAAGPWQVPAFHVGDGQALLEATRRRSLEGLVAKRLDSIYLPGTRSRSWLKLKNRCRQEFVIGGWMPGRGRRDSGVGSLLLGYFEAGALRYAGRVGTGFTDAELDRLGALLQARPAESPFAPSSPLPPGVSRHARFTVPDLVVEVEFAEWTRDAVLRAPSYRGLRADKPAGEVVRERPE